VDTNTPLQVVCCFCGESLLFSDAIKLVVVPAGEYETEGQQTLYCHAVHLRQAVLDGIPVDVTDLTPDDEAT
jgi:hypothetical protein